MLGVSTALPISGFAGFALAAALCDARTLRIPNILSAGILGLFGVYAAIALTPQAAALALALSGLTLIIGFIAYSCGVFGGGDAKLLAVCIAWAGPSFAPQFLAVTALAGGIVAVALTSPWTAAAVVQMQRQWPADTGGRAPMPYGVAIAAGAMTVVVELFSL